MPGRGLIPGYKKPLIQQDLWILMSLSNSSFPGDYREINITSTTTDDNVKAIGISKWGGIQVVMGDLLAVQVPAESQFNRNTCNNNGYSLLL